MNFHCIYFGCLVCFVLFLKQRFPVAPIKLDLCFIECPVGYRPVSGLLPSTCVSLSLFSVSLVSMVKKGSAGSQREHLQCGPSLSPRTALRVEELLEEEGFVFMCNILGQAFRILSAPAHHSPNSKSWFLSNQPVSNAAWGQVYQVLSTGCWGGGGDRG